MNITEVHYKTSADMPELIRTQVIDFLRINYPEGFAGENLYRDWTSNTEFSPEHIVITADDYLISHTEILTKTLIHNGNKYLVRGLSGVLTYPQFRGQGYGGKIVELGSEYIEQSGCDVGMFSCNPELGKFYEKYGWIPMKKSTVLCGKEDSPETSDELLMMQFYSGRAIERKSDFIKVPMYFGEDTW